MLKYLAAAALALVLPGMAQADNTPQPNATPGTFGLTADGTVDCNDAGGTYLSGVAVADLSYAFLNPDESVGIYGKVKMDKWLDHPAFFIQTDGLRDSFAAVGLSITAPEGNPDQFYPLV